MQNRLSDSDKFKEKIFDLAFQATRDKFGILPILSGLVLALLALGSAGDLFPVTITIKYLATILLLLMILSLQVYHTEVIKLGANAVNELNSLIGLENSVSVSSYRESLWYLISGRIRGKKENRTFFERFSSQFSGYAMLVLWYVVGMMILELWC